MESFPFFLFLTALIGIIILALGFNQLSMFITWSNQNDFVDDYAKLSDTIKILKDNSYEGSFKKISIKVPKGTTLEFDTKEDAIIINGQKRIVNKLNVDLLKTTFNDKLESGSYNLVIYYGEPDSHNYERFALYFK